MQLTLLIAVLLLWEILYCQDPALIAAIATRSRQTCMAPVNILASNWCQFYLSACRVGNQIMGYQWFVFSFVNTTKEPHPYDFESIWLKNFEDHTHFMVLYATSVLNYLEWIFINHNPFVIFQGVVTAATSLITTLSQKNPDEFKTSVSLAVSRLSRVSIHRYLMASVLFQDFLHRQCV